MNLYNFAKYQKKPTISTLTIQYQLMGDYDNKEGCMSQFSDKFLIFIAYTLEITKVIIKSPCVSCFLIGVVLLLFAALRPPRNPLS